MGIERRKAVTRKVLADRRHARGRESLHDAGAERADRVGVEVQRAVADGRAGSVVEVEHRREAEIDAVGGKLRGADVGGAARRLARRLAVAVLVGQCATDYVDDHRPERTLYFSHSRITVANATPRSSDKETWECRIFLLRRRSSSSLENCSTGCPEGRFFTHTPCQLAGAWMPVPSALAKASLAAKRLAR